MIGPVLVVDDEIQAREVVRPKAERAFEVLLCRSLADAHVAAGRTDLAGIVVDVRLPDGSGLEWVRDLRSRDSTIPVLVITGHRDPQYEEEARRQGAWFARKLDDDYRNRLHEFFNYVVAESIESLPDLKRALFLAASTWGLRAHETLVIGAYHHEPTRAGVARKLGLDEETVKSRVHSILIKARLPEMSAVHCAVLAIARQDRLELG